MHTRMPPMWIHTQVHMQGRGWRGCMCSFRCGIAGCFSWCLKVFFPMFLIFLFQPLGQEQEPSPSFTPDLIWQTFVGILTNSLKPHIFLAHSCQEQVHFCMTLASLPWWVSRGEGKEGHNKHIFGAYSVPWPGFAGEAIDMFSAFGVYHLQNNWMCNKGRGRGAESNKPNRVNLAGVGRIRNVGNIGTTVQESMERFKNRNTSEKSMFSILWRTVWRLLQKLNMIQQSHFWASIQRKL